MIKKEDLPTLSQLVKVLEDSYDRLERAYRNKDSESFNKLKGMIVQTERRILQMLR
jgi:hypothetical protein